MLLGRLKTVLSALVLASGISDCAAEAQQAPVDLDLVLAVDCSFSVSPAEFQLQMRGMGQALRNVEVWNAIKGGPRKRIAILVIEWSDKENQQVVFPWTVLSTEKEVLAAGYAIEAIQRNLVEGGTAISRAIEFAAAQFQLAPAATRRVIDVSFDGRNNTGPPLPVVRNEIVRAGVVINALPITNEVPTLDVYAEKQLIGGEGAFVVKADDHEAYGEAILRKLLKEIVGPGIT